MSTKRTEMTLAERAYRVVAQAIPPILATGHVSQAAGLWLLGIFVLMFVVAGISTSRRTGRRRRTAAVGAAWLTLVTEPRGGDSSGGQRLMLRCNGTKSLFLRCRGQDWHVGAARPV